MPMPPPLIRDGDVEFTVGRAVLPRLTVPTVQVHRLAVVPGAPVRGFLADALVVGVGAGAAVLVAAPAARVLLRAVALAAVGPFARTGVNPLRAPLPRAIAGASAGALAGARAGARAAEARTGSLLVVLLRRRDGPRRRGGPVLGQVLGRRERVRGPLAIPVQHVGQIGVDLDVLPRARVVREPPPLDEHPGLRVRSRVGTAASGVGLRVRSGVCPAAASSSSGPAVAGPTASGAVAPRPSRVGRGDAGAGVGVGRGSRAARRERGALAPAAGTRVGHATAGAAVGASSSSSSSAAASSSSATAAATAASAASSSAAAAALVHGDDALRSRPVLVHEHERPAAVLQQVLAERGGRELIEQVLLDPRAVHVRLLLPLDEVLEAAGQGREGGRGRTRAEHRLHLFPAFDVVLERSLVVPAGGSRGGWRTFPRVFAHRDVVPDDAASREEYAPVRGAEDPRVAGDPDGFLRRVRRRHHRQPAGSPHRGRRRRGNREAVLHHHGSLLIRRLLIRMYIRLVRLANPAL